MDNLDEKSEDSIILHDLKTLLFKECVKNILEYNKKGVDSSNKINIIKNKDKENQKPINNIINQNDNENKIKKQISVISIKKKKKEDKKTSKNFLCKKRIRNLFTINNHKEFSVFNHEENNNYPRINSRSH